MAAEDFSKYVLSLESLAEQGLAERVNHAIPELIANILDPNTDAKKPRTLTIKVEIHPDAERRNLVVGFNVTTTLQKLKKFVMPGFLTRDPDTKQPVIIAFDPQQGDMFRGAAPGATVGLPSGVVPIDSAAKAREG